MESKLLTGKLVRLVAQDPEKHAATEAGWEKDTVYVRLLDVGPVTPPNTKPMRERMEKEPNPKFYPFSIVTLAEDKLIGSTLLMRVSHTHGEAYVGIGIGEGEFRGKGYGSDALRVLLRFGFQELNLHRVSLDAVATNAQAVRSYEKCGFVPEGFTRGTDYRDGVHTDLVSMGILRTEWVMKQNDA